jgi:hypothetical protein
MRYIWVMHPEVADTFFGKMMVATMPPEAIVLSKNCGTRNVYRIDTEALDEPINFDDEDWSWNRQGMQGPKPAIVEVDEITRLTSG